MTFSALPKHSTDFDSTAVSLRNTYFGCSNESIDELPLEAIFFWRRIAKVQKMSGLNAANFLQCQMDWFDYHEIDPMTPEAVESLGTEGALKRAREFTQGGSRNDEGLSKVTDSQADHALKVYEHWRRQMFPKDLRQQNPKSDIWRRIVLRSEQSGESLDDFIRASFVFAANKGLKKPPTPQLIASKEALQRSLEVNRTILDGPRK